MSRRNRPKHLLPLAAIITCFIAIAWIARDHSTPGADPDQMESGSPDSLFAAAPEEISDDATTANFLSQTNRGEALAWLSDAQSSRGVARWEKTEAIDLIKDFYKAGATQVYIVDTIQVAQTEVASQFVVVLPTDPTLRKQIFTCEANFEAQYDETPTPDSGQKYLHLTTD